MLNFLTKGNIAEDFRLTQNNALQAIGLVNNLIIARLHTNRLYWLLAKAVAIYS